jgi:hypothetical protein
MVERRCVIDLTMRLRPGATVPSLLEMSVSPKARALVEHALANDPALSRG